MQKNPLEVQHLNGTDWQKDPFEKVILPLGSLENHGGHLPFATDTFTAHQIALEVAAKIPKTAVLPPLNYGASDHYRNFPFTVSLGFETEIAVIEDILNSVYRAGIRKVFIMNGHDGNISPIDIAARRVKVANPEIKIVSMDAWWYAVGDMVGEGFYEVWDGLGHAGEGETSMSLALFPALCDMSKAAGVVPDLPPYVDIKWTFDELTDKGASGDPTKASREKGLKMRTLLVDKLVEILQNLDEKGWDYRSPGMGG